MKKRLFNVVLTFTLAGLLILTACPTDGGGGGGIVNTDALQLKITEAKTERDNTRVSLINGTDVPLGMYWVAQQVMTEFVGAIATAEAVLLIAQNQTAVNNATANLEGAINTFKNARESGKATPVNMTALAAKIAEAESEKDQVVVDTSAANVAYGRYWVTATVMETFDAAIDAAINVLNTAAIQQAVDTAASTLDTAITVFKNARGTGTRQTGFTAQELADLIASANAAKQGVHTSTANGDDIGPVNYWVSQNDLDSLNNAISAAQNATGNIDNPYLALVTALNNFNLAKRHGTTPDKNALTQAIVSANQMRDTILVAASAAQAPLGSLWATAAQWAPLNTAYDSALAALNNSDASKNVVDGATSALAAATAAFTSAVQANGPGTNENTASVTVNGLPYPNGTEIQLFLFLTDENIDLNARSLILGEGTVQNGTVNAGLFEYPSGTPWYATGSWYVVLYAEPGETSISTAAINFSANSNPVINFSSFRKYAFSYRLGDFDEWAFESVSQMTLDQWFTEMAGLTYTEYVSQYPAATFYKNQAMTQPFSGSDIVNADTVIYTQAYMGGGNQSEKIGEITGTITLTGISSPAQRVYISVEGRDDNYYNWWNSSSSRINMNNVTGTTATLSWSIPVYENNGFFPSIGMFRLSVTPAGSSQNNDYRITIPTQPYINSANADVGSLGTVNIQSVTLSGTLNVTYGGNPVPGVRIDVYKVDQQGGGDNWLGNTSLSPSGATTSWSITIAALDASTEIYFYIMGYPNAQANWEQLLFEEWFDPDPPIYVHNQNVQGITLIVGNIPNLFDPVSVTPLTANTWVDGTITASGEVRWYSIDFTSGTRYLWWNDSYQGDSTKTLDVEVRAWDRNGNIISSFNSDSAWYSPAIFTANATGRVYLMVRSYGGGSNTGTYGIAFSTVNSRP